MRAALARLGAALFLGFILATPMTANAETRPETMSARAAMLQSHATLTLPEGDGPFPVVILMHGCGGRRPQMMENYARAANEAGAAALIVDSWRPRGIGRLGAISTICTGARLRGRERAGDLYAMADWVRQQSWADPNRIIAAGWSHGAWSIMDALALHSGEEMRRATNLSDLPDEPLQGLAGAFLVYPYVGPPAIAGRRPWRLQPQTLAIIGGRDLIVGTKSPTRALERQIEYGAPIDIHLFETATHSFDELTALDPRIRYDPDLSARAETLLQDLVARTR
jgi:dienelactone hydrolase